MLFGRTALHGTAATAALVGLQQLLGLLMLLGMWLAARRSMSTVKQQQQMVLAVT
jgi:hypothetical protein